MTVLDLLMLMDDVELVTDGQQVYIFAQRSLTYQEHYWIKALKHELIKHLRRVPKEHLPEQMVYM